MLGGWNEKRRVSPCDEGNSLSSGCVCLGGWEAMKRNVIIFNYLVPGRPPPPPAASIPSSEKLRRIHREFRPDPASQKKANRTRQYSFVLISSNKPISEAPLFGVNYLPPEIMPVALGLWKIHESEERGLFLCPGSFGNLRIRAISLVQ